MLSVKNKKGKSKELMETKTKMTENGKNFFVVDCIVVFCCEVFRISCDFHFVPLYS